MSRSRKKHNIVTDHRANSTKWAKRQANKKVRRSLKDILLNGNLYKKLYETYNICDYKFESDDPKDLRK